MGKIENTDSGIPEEDSNCLGAEPVTEKNEKSRTIDPLQLSIDMKDAMIGNLGEVITRKENQIYEQKVILQFYKEALEGLQQNLNASQQALNDIFNSRSWKVIRRSLHWLDKLCPPDSRRRKVLRKIASFFIH